ncbi:MAG TPA: extracellular solute-binding protein [Mesotoga infera]|jgi:spermidine/putrescine transport system substrate-binding protein|uniref:Spermidine/putrescine-binding periplasmic protein n=1 Tax=Mesotoga infera TaxID=1236046 RepID=A0A7Z7PPF6_9BACT|nr:extracellular solute-binding protein [Mesotoga infera]MBP8659628.1 extracellular solute-binding protein [Mesotoga sp.]NLI06115.1 extracellular solute-binding protein [Thermotogaceae bacterium]SSC12994.1 Spermidine/putrescine-binding periplasmic protein [Mesotoga infera]HNS66955.1 extracellular solute-binding protein [Mesotoga infera]HON27715.1 extracellular solute-binding protein [Mesotoga infera]
MKRATIFLFLVLLAVLSLGKGNLILYGWSDYIPEEVIENFSKEYDVKVTYDTYDSNETMFAKLKAGARGYDLAMPSADYTSIMIKENMLLKIDRSKIDNLINIDPDIIEQMYYDPNNEYSIPYMVGTTGIAVNTLYLQDYPKSWEIFQMPELRGKMTLLDDMREVFGAALKYLGYSVNTTDEAQLKEAKNLILEWKKNIAKFDNELFAKGVISGEFWVVHGYGENIFYEATEEELENIDFFIPREGSTMWIDSFVILKGARNIDNAHLFINYILRPEVSAKISDYLLLPSPNVPARELMEEEPVYTAQEMENTELIKDLGRDLRLYNDLWNEIRFGL